jgi:glycosyltransferase involved in cell wall biosynthesis
VVFNGVLEEEFAPRTLTEDASDLLFIGELRQLKGVDVLLNALTEVHETFPARITIVGEGADGEAFKALAEDLGLGGHVRFTGALPAREAFAPGRNLVVPSRAESLP